MIYFKKLSKHTLQYPEKSINFNFDTFRMKYWSHMDQIYAFESMNEQNEKAEKDTDAKSYIFSSNFSFMASALTHSFHTEIILLFFLLQPSHVLWSKNFLTFRAYQNSILIILVSSCHSLSLIVLLSKHGLWKLSLVPQLFPENDIKVSLLFPSSFLSYPPSQFLSFFFFTLSHHPNAKTVWL